MKKALFLLIVCLITGNVFAQQRPRLMDIPANQTPVAGESLYVFTMNGSRDLSVVLSIDDVKIGHFFDGETAEIAISDGSHVVRAYQYRWDSRSNGWIENYNDRLTDTLQGDKYPVTVNMGPVAVRLRGGRMAKLSLAPAPAGQTATQTPQTVTQTSQPGTGVAGRTGIEGAVARASVVFVGELPARSTIAVISVSSRNDDLATFAIDELEYQLVTARQFTIVDRKMLDTIRNEQNFQISGEVSDQSAVSIGNLLGASIVITGSITGEGNTQRITLRALDVKTAQIVSMAREQF